MEADRSKWRTKHRVVFKVGLLQSNGTGGFYWQRAPAQFYISDVDTESL